MIKKTNQINTESNVCTAVPNTFSLAVSVYLIDRQSKSVATNEFNERNVSIRINGKMYSKKVVAFVMTCGSIIHMVWCNDTDERNFIDKEKNFINEEKNAVSKKVMANLELM